MSSVLVTAQVPVSITPTPESLAQRDTDGSLTAAGAGFIGPAGGLTGVPTDVTTALALKAPLASPALTGSPTAPTQASNDDSTKIATTAFVRIVAAAVAAALVNSAPGTLDTLNELAAALGNDPNFATSVATSLSLKAPIAGPTFTGIANFGSTGGHAQFDANGDLVARAGTVFSIKNSGGTGVFELNGDFGIPGWPYGFTVPTSAPGTNTTQVANTAFVTAAVASVDVSGKANLAGGNSFSGTQTITGSFNVVGGVFTFAVNSSGVPDSLHYYVGGGTTDLYTDGLIIGSTTGGMRAGPAFAPDIYFARSAANTWKISSDGADGAANLIVAGNVTAGLGLASSSSAPAFIGPQAPGELYPGIWFGSAAVARTYANYSFLFDPAGTVVFNTVPGGSIHFRVNNVTKMVMDSDGALAVTGPVTTVTAAPGTNTTQVATTEFVRGEFAALIGMAPEALDTWIEVTDAIEADTSGLAALVTVVDGKLNTSTFGEYAIGMDGILAGKADVSSLGTAAFATVGTASGNVPALDSEGLLPVSTFPSSLVHRQWTADEATMLATSPTAGDVVLRSDLGSVPFIFLGNDPSSNAFWLNLQALKTPATNVVDEAAMLALPAVPGNFVTRDDSPGLYILAGADPTSVDNWFKFWTDHVPNMTAYKVGGTQVVGAQQAAIPDTIDASVAALEVEVNLLKAMARSHGLIAS